MKSIVVIGRRWFQKSCGNTYNSANILVDGVHVAHLSKAYGYGDYYMQRAAEWLEANGRIVLKHYDNGGSEQLSVWARRSDVTLYSEVIDVAKERDL